jgi:hypothetical protein
MRFDPFERRQGTPKLCTLLNFVRTTRQKRHAFANNRHSRSFFLTFLSKEEKRKSLFMMVSARNPMIHNRRSQEGGFNSLRLNFRKIKVHNFTMYVSIITVRVLYCTVRRYNVLYEGSTYYVALSYQCPIYLRTMPTLCPTSYGLLTAYCMLRKYRYFRTEVLSYFISYLRTKVLSYESTFVRNKLHYCM